ncbi:MAG: hypothetical protein ACTHMG_05630 [Sphingomonas sp.]
MKTLPARPASLSVAAQGRVARARLAALLFVFVWLSGAWFGSWALNPNNATRMFAAVSLVESHDATIDEFAPETIDKAEFGGHFYMDKAPGMTLMAVPIVAAYDAAIGNTAVAQHRLTPEFGADYYLKPRVWLAAALTSALLTAIAATLLFLATVDLTDNTTAALIAAIGYALATPIWGWSTTIFGHAASAALLLIATIEIWRGTRGVRPSSGHAFVAGLTLGWGFVVEYQAALTGAVIGCWALYRLWRYPAAMRVRPVALAVAGGLIAAVPLAIYNLVAFGTLFKLGYEGVVGFAGMQEGLFGLTYPKWSVFWQIIGGMRRGMIWVAPILVLAPIGLGVLIRRRETRDLGVVAAVAALMVLLINASYVYWDGGSSTGPRLSVPAIGFLSLGLGPLWMLSRHWAARGATLLVLAVSVVLNLIIAAAEITAPDGIPFPLWSYVIRQRFRSGQLRDLPAELWHWTPWEGFFLYLAVAAAFAVAMGWTLRRTRLADQAG